MEKVCCTSGFRLLLMIVMTSSYFFVEILVGYLTRSNALVADSFHMLSDIIALVVAYMAVRVSPKDWSKNTFGYARAEVLGALVNAVFLIALCFTIFVEAIKRFLILETITDPFLVLIVGGVGLAVNVVGLVIFKDGHSHGGGHGHSHGGHSHEDKSGSQMNIHGVFLHVLADAIGSVIVMISASIVWLTDWEYKDYIDPALSLVLIFLIVLSTWPLFRDSAMILLQTVPSHLEVDSIRKQILEEIPEIVNVHEFHVWNLVGRRIVASLHVTLLENCDDHMEVSRRIKEFFHRKGIHSTTTQLEYSESTSGFIEDSVIENSCVLTCPTHSSSSNSLSKTEDNNTSTIGRNKNANEANYPDIIAGNADCVSATCCGPRNRRKVDLVGVQVDEPGVEAANF